MSNYGAIKVVNDLKPNANEGNNLHVIVSIKWQDGTLTTLTPSINAGDKHSFDLRPLVQVHVNNNSNANPTQNCNLQVQVDPKDATLGDTQSTSDGFTFWQKTQNILTLKVTGDSSNIHLTTSE